MLDPPAPFLLFPAMSGALNLPNLLTIGRIAAIPVICLLLAIGGTAFVTIALVLYIAAAVTDWLDGYLARRMNLGTPLGRMLDPIADKLLVGALLVALAWTGSFSALDLVPAIAIMMREIFVSGLREYLGPKGVVVHVTALAKWKTTVQLVALGIVIAERLIPGLGLVSDAALWIAGILTAVTGWQYLAGALPHLAEPPK